MPPQRMVQIRWEDVHDSGLRSRALCRRLGVFFSNIQALPFFAFSSHRRLGLPTMRDPA